MIKIFNFKAHVLILLPALGAGAASLSLGGCNCIDAQGYGVACPQ